MSGFRGIKMTLVFSEPEVPFLLDISSILYDLELLHDLMLLVFVEDYYRYQFSYFYYRNRRPVKPSHKIRAVKIIKASPLTLELAIVGIAAVSGALWAFIQALDKIGNWRLNREKLKREIEILELEADERKLRNEGMRIYVSLLKRFERNPIKLVDASFEEIEE